MIDQPGNQGRMSCIMCMNVTDSLLRKFVCHPYSAWKQQQCPRQKFGAATILSYHSRQQRKVLARATEQSGYVRLQQIQGEPWCHMSTLEPWTRLLVDDFLSLEDERIEFHLPSERLEMNHFPKNKRFR